MGIDLCLWDSANLSQLTSNARARAYIAYRGVRGGDLERARKKDRKGKCVYRESISRRCEAPTNIIHSSTRLPLTEEAPDGGITLTGTGAG